MLRVSSPKPMAAIEPALLQAAQRHGLNVLSIIPVGQLLQGLELESDLWSNLAATEDMKEGAKAFIEKRKPQYRGR